MKTPEEKTKDFIVKNYQKEKDKWDSGLKNEKSAWQDFKEDFENFNSTMKELATIKRVINSNDFKDYFKRKGFTNEEIENLKNYILGE